MVHLSPWKSTASPSRVRRTDSTGFASKGGGFKHFFLGPTSSLGTPSLRGPQTTSSHHCIFVLLTTHSQAQESKGSCWNTGSLKPSGQMANEGGLAFVSSSITGPPSHSVHTVGFTHPVQARHTEAEPSQAVYFGKGL